MKLPEKLDFLTATRFWAAVILSAGTILVDPDFASKPWYYNLGKFLIALSAIFIGVKTADKNLGEAKILSAGVTTGEIAAKDATTVPPEK